MSRATPQIRALASPPDSGSKSEPHGSTSLPRNEKAIPGDAAPRPPKRRWRRWFLWLLIFVIAAVGGIWLAREPIMNRMESELVQRLAEHGIYLRYARRSWSFGRLHLEEVVLNRDARGEHPLIEVSAFSVGISVPELVKTHRLTSRWSMKNATVTLHDDAGAITFEHVTTKIVVRAQEIDTPRVDFQQGPRTFALSGKILLPGQPPAPGPLAINLAIARQVLSNLNFKEGHAPFAIQASYSVDLRAKEPFWQADVTSAGRDVEWQGIPMRVATARGQVSAKGMNVACHVEFARGSADVSLKRRDWGASPLLIIGSLTDGARQGDEVSAAFDFATLTFSSIRGKANLLEFAGNFPMLAPHIPRDIQFQTSPDLVVTNYSYSFAKKSDVWSVESIQIHSASDVTLPLGGERLKIHGLEGVIAFADNTWKAQLKGGPVNWRLLSARGADIDGTLAGSLLQAKLDLWLTKGSAALELSSTDLSRAPLRFTGSITDSQGLIDRLTGSYQGLPVELRIAKLSGKANLLEYLTNFPGMTGPPPKGLGFRAFPEIALTDFTFLPGKPVTLGSLRLLSPADLTVTFRDHPVAVDHVEGEAGFDGHAWQFSGIRGRLFDGQFSLDGSYENGTLRRANITASNLHLAKLKAWLGDSPNAIGEAILAFDYRGSIGSDPSQFAGAGRIRMDNAPIVKVPLLDQTYAVASALTSPLARHGAGRLDATFTSADGIAKVSQFTATSDAVKVTAEGTLDLKRWQVSGRAHARLCGLFGAALSPLCRTFEMQVSGPLDDIRVRPIGVKGILSAPKNLVPDTAKGVSKLIQDGVTLPFRFFDLVKPDPAASKH